MNILDLKKGDKVYGGVMRKGNGCVVNMGYMEELTVRSIVPANRDYGASSDHTWLRIRLANNNGVITDEYLFDKSIYASEEDFLDGKNISTAVTYGEIWDKMAKIFGLDKDRYGYALIWKWDAEKKIAKSACWTGNYNLANLQFPEGYYPTKEACEKANRKMVTIEVTKTYLTEREEGDDAEWLLNHPDEYEWSDDDECMSDAKYSD